MSLTDLSYYLRKFAPFVLVLFLAVSGLFVILFVALGTSSQKTVTSQLIKRTETLDTSLGKLDPLHLPQNATLDPSASFVMDNIEGRPIVATSSANIYFIPPVQTKFGYETRVKNMAKRLGFDTEKENFTLSSTTATYQNTDQTLGIDIATFNFTQNYNSEAILKVIGNTSLASENRIQESAREYLRQMGHYNARFAKTREVITYLRFDENIKDFVSVARSDEANAVRIDYKWPDIDGRSVLGDLTTSNNYVVLTFSQNVALILKSKVLRFDPSEKPQGTYPLRSGDEAFTDLKSGRAFVLRNNSNSSTIKITNMYLAYYDDSQYQSYLQPIFVFEGVDRSFIAYVPAVKDDWIGAAQ